MGLFVAETDLKSGPRSGDAEVAVTEASDQVEGLAGGLLLREPQGVVGDVLLDRFTHLTGRAEEAVGRHQAVERLVRPLEVVAVDEETQSTDVVAEVREDRAAQKLVPERLPEALHLAEGFGVLRPAADVANAAAP